MGGGFGVGGRCSASVVGGRRRRRWCDRGSRTGIGTWRTATLGAVGLSINEIARLTWHAVAVLTAITKRAQLRVMVTATEFANQFGLLALAASAYMHAQASEAEEGRRRSGTGATTSIGRASATRASGTTVGLVTARRARQDANGV